MSGLAGASHQGIENWRLSQRPLVAGERGGIQWRSGATYAPGDIATYGANTYVALSPVTGSTPGGTSGEWKYHNNDLERGGIIWRSGENYKVGDIVYDRIGNGAVAPNDGIGSYVCISNISGGNTVPSLTLSNWSTQINVDPGTYA